VSSLVLALACENAGSTGSADAGAAGAGVTSGSAGAAVNGGASSNAGGTSAGGASSGGLGTSSGGLESSTAGFGGTATSGGAASPGGASGAGGSATSSGGGDTGGASNTGGKTATAPTPEAASLLVISTNGTWSTGETWTESTREAVDVTVNDTERFQKWDGVGGAFHERGCAELSTPELFDEAMQLLFGADGARFILGRLPIGASDYAIDRYTLDDTGADVEPDEGESNRPLADLELARFSIARDEQTLIPCIQGALRINPELWLWAVPFTPPVWMKTGYIGRSLADGGPVVRPSYFDGGAMRSDAATLSAYAQYFARYIQAYAAEGITIQAVAPQSEPTLDMNYPSCLWNAPTYRSFVIDHLAPALAEHAPGTAIMLAMLGNEGGDPDLLSATLNDPAASSVVSSVGVQWGLLSRLLLGAPDYGVPVWVTEHKCGNYPFITSARSGPPPIPAYTEPPPNDQNYGVETWWYIRDAIRDARVSAYHFPHLVLDRRGLGNDTSRRWAQNSLLVVDGGKITKTQAYYVARHFSEFVVPGATVLGTAGGDAVAFENPDGSLVAIVYSPEARSDYTVAIGGKKLQFAIPASGWATVKFTP